jgi:hypothetical protein
MYGHPQQQSPRGGEMNISKEKLIFRAQQILNY